MGKLTKLAQLWSEPTDDFKNNILQNLDYGRYLLKHKWNVGAAGIKMGVPLGKLLAHDYTKFKPQTFSVYRDFRFGPEGIRGTNSPALYKDFRKKVQEHYESEDHHNYKVGKPSDVETQMESVADWYSVAKTKADMEGGTFPDFKKWWNDSKFNFLAKDLISLEVFNKIEEMLRTNPNLYSYLADKVQGFFKSAEEQTITVDDKWFIPKEVIRNSNRGVTYMAKNDGSPKLRYIGYGLKDFDGTFFDTRQAIDPRGYTANYVDNVTIPHEVLGNTPTSGD